MAGVTAYKQYRKRDRRAVLETNFLNGMKSSLGAIDEGYLKTLVNFTYEKESGAIVPRPGIVASSIIFPDMAFTDTAAFLSENVSIKASKECVEQGVTYNQIILGKLNDTSDSEGEIWVSTSQRETDPTQIDFSDEYGSYVNYTESANDSTGHKCFFSSAVASMIHNVELEADAKHRVSTPVGSFAFGNNYYFMGKDGNNAAGLFRTKFSAEASPHKYIFEKVTPKPVSVSEAVTYGYNMLLGTSAYTFTNKHQAALMEFEGILPYERNTTNLIMAPKKNQPIDLVCYYDVINDRKFEIIWEWRETTASDWTEIQSSTVTFGSNTELKVSNFKPPAQEIMIRVSAYPYEDAVMSDTVEKAMVVGFDFSEANYSNTKTYEQKTYDLTTAKGMAHWNGRLVLWGIPEDPTILFISDYNEPAYFPYPNNISTFDAPIIDAVEFMGNLVVFTTDRIYQVALSKDATSWVVTTLQSHLNISPWDRHLIQTVRNMLYFKSGNYYYMMVPKAQSLTGELTLAPITNPITSFFDRFSVNVQEILKNTYSYDGVVSLLTYYNFLDYEDMHNVYVFAFDESSSILNFDVVYNTVDRTWKVWTYETPNLVYPYRQDATQLGLLATTSLIKTHAMTTPTVNVSKRIIHIYKWDKMTVEEYFLPYNIELVYNPDVITPTIEDGHISLPAGYGYIDNNHLILTNPDLAYVRGKSLHLLSAGDFYSGFNKQDIITVLLDVYNHPEEYYTFRNFQYLDTGYRNEDIYTKKRYREVQLQVNNLDQRDLSFGMEYMLDGAPRQLLYKYDVSQKIDVFDNEYGVIYVDSTPYLETDLSEIDNTNQWSIDHDLICEVTLWKVRVSISGKGTAPRLKLFSRNGKRFELLGINWISKVMNMR